MRITSGQYRGRAIKAPPGMDVRPTSDKVRQAVFNILYGMGYPLDAQVLDAFCGTGALGLESLSRGAEHCVFIDNAPTSLQCCKDNVAAAGATERSKIMRLDATKPGARPAGIAPADLFFLDPPYRKNLVPPALIALAGQGWLAAGSLGVIETEKDGGDAPPPGFQSLDTRSYGDTRIALVKFEGV